MPSIIPSRRAELIAFPALTLLNFPKYFFMKHLLLTTILLTSIFLTFALSSCIYRVDIEQGNAIDEDKLAKLELGMSKKQVNFLLGKPAIKDIYHNNSWHYLRYLKHNDGATSDISTMILEFKDEQLINIKGSL